MNDQSQALALAVVSDEFIPESARVPRAPGAVDPLSGVPWISCDEERLPFHVQVMQTDASPIPLDGIEEPWPASIVVIGAFGCMELQFNDRVEFSDKAVDRFGMPALKIHCSLTEKDHQTFDEMAAALTRIANVVGELAGGRPPVALPVGA